MGVTKLGPSFIHDIDGWFLRRSMLWSAGSSLDGRSKLPFPTYIEESIHCTTTSHAKSPLAARGSSSCCWNSNATAIQLHGLGDRDFFFWYWIVFTRDGIRATSCLHHTEHESHGVLWVIWVLIPLSLRLGAMVTWISLAPVCDVVFTCFVTYIFFFHRFWI